MLFNSDSKLWHRKRSQLKLYNISYTNFPCSLKKDNLKLKEKKRGGGGGLHCTLSTYTAVRSILHSACIYTVSCNKYSDKSIFCYIFYTKPNIFKISLKCHFYLNFIEINTQQLRIVRSLFVYLVIISCMRNCQNVIN